MNTNLLLQRKGTWLQIFKYWYSLFILKTKRDKFLKRGKDMNENLTYDIDNRDEDTTWLRLSNGNYVEVRRRDLFELLFNMAENQGDREEEVVNDIVSEFEAYLVKEKYYNECGKWNKGR